MNSSIRSKKRVSTGALMIGIALVIVGFGTIGYIPGKPMIISLIGIIAVVIGIIFTAVYVIRRRPAERRSYRRY